MSTSTTNMLSLNWRDAPPTSEIISRLSRLFVDLDERREVSMRLSSTTAKTVSLVKDGGSVMLRRKNNMTKRTFTAAAARKYFYPLFEITKTLISMQQDQQALMSRFIAYKDVEPKMDMRLERVKRLILDLTLTIGVHPVALGVKAEPSGQVSIPTSCRIEAELVTNVFSYINREKTPGQEYRREERMKAGVHTIPEPVLSLKVKMTMNVDPPGRVDAVIVVEHRNLSEILLKESFALDNVIIVMTAGFSDFATKEFLHLLSCDWRVSKVFFLFFADHDAPGFSIFQVLKYGSRTSAWVSPISVCPKLRYVGPTVEDLTNSPVLLRPKWEEQYRLDNPHAGNAAVKTAADTWQRETVKKIEGKFTALTKKDKETLRSFEKLGWLQEEPLVRREITDMRRKGVFRFANLAQAGTQYVRQFMEAKVLEYCPTRVSVFQPAVPAGSPTTREFRQLSSQVERPETVASVSEVETTTQADIAESLTSDVNLELAVVEMF